MKTSSSCLDEEEVRLIWLNLYYFLCNVKLWFALKVKLSFLVLNLEKKNNKEILMNIKPLNKGC